MNFRPRWRRREIMGFGEPWRVIHSLPCTNSPVIHPQALRPPLPVCLPHSARLTFLPPKCIYISPPSSGSTLPHTWYHVQKGGSGMKSKGETLPVSHQPLIQTAPAPPTQWWKCRSVILPLILAHRPVWRRRHFPGNWSPQSRPMSRTTG